MSNVKRKDSKNRNLRNGESQRKDGRYLSLIHISLGLIALFLKFETLVENLSVSHKIDLLHLPVHMLILPQHVLRITLLTENFHQDGWHHDIGHSILRQRKDSESAFCAAHPRCV